MELSEWAEFERLEGPIGPEREDFRAGIVASATANVWRDKKVKPARPIDFMPFQKRRDRPKTLAEQKAAFMRATAMLGGTIKRGDR